VTGDTVAHRELERDLAATKGTERAITFSSGYAANVGIITSLYPNVVFSDEYNHASIIEGVRMSGADVVTYDHCDTADLAEKMVREANAARSFLSSTGSTPPAVAAAHEAFPAVTPRIRHVQIGPTRAYG
jgi:7-keto-8-aminopelargonate synthetase-like enzyme